MDILTLGAAFLAGILTFLNPCVLPVLPIVFGSAANAHRHGPVALAAGLALSFTAVGLFIATVGISLGIDGSLFRMASAVMLIIFGVFLAVPQAQYRLQTAMGPLSNWASARSQHHQGDGLGGQFALGALLGAMWSPCVGPTLGAATLLAAQGQQLPLVTLSMLLFGIGAAIPLLILGTVLRSRLQALRGHLGTAGRRGRLLLGGAMMIAGLLVVSGLDKRLEILFLDVAPAWAITLGTRL